MEKPEEVSIDLGLGTVTHNLSVLWEIKKGDSMAS
jgi:hypothetical protein